MRDYPTRPHNAVCGQLFGDNTADTEVVRKLKGPTRKTVCQQEQCGNDGIHTIKLADGIGLAVCSTHHPDKVGPDY